MNLTEVEGGDQKIEIEVVKWKGSELVQKGRQKNEVAVKVTEIESKERIVMEVKRVIQEITGTTRK